MHIPQHPDSESAFSLLSKHETTNYHKKQTGQFFQNNTLYCDVKDNMLEQKVPEKKIYYFCNNGGTSQKHNW